MLFRSSNRFLKLPEKHRDTVRSKSNMPANKKHAETQAEGSATYGHSCIALQAWRPISVEEVAYGTTLPYEHPDAHWTSGGSAIVIIKSRGAGSLINRRLVWHGKQAFSHPRFCIPDRLQALLIAALRKVLPLTTPSPLSMVQNTGQSKTTTGCISDSDLAGLRSLLRQILVSLNRQG